MTIYVRETGALLAAVAAAIGDWLRSAGVAHAEPQCPTNMTKAQCDFYNNCMSVVRDLDVPAGGSWDDPGGCREAAYTNNS